MKKFIVFCLLVAVVFACKDKPEEVALKEPTLFETFRIPYSGPQISVHRGGMDILNYPENCLETLKYVNDSINAIYEIDISQTKDGHLVLMHDNSIDRTTTGSGLVKDITLKELKAYNLKDHYGNITNFKVPLFSEVLKWSTANNVILTVDIKRGVPQEKVIKAVERANAEDTSIIITYHMEQAKSAYKTNPNLMLSVSARNMEEYQWLLNSNIPTENMIAFTGTRLSDKKLYEAIHKENIVCMLGSLGNLDNRAKANGDDLYKAWFNLGIDIMATDRPFEVVKVLEQ